MQRPARSAPRARDDGWKAAPRVQVAVQPQAHLAQMRSALNSPRRFAGCLNRRQQQRNQHRDDGDHHQKLHHREAVACAAL